MINNIKFLNNQWLWQIIIVTLLLLIVFAWKEYKQINKSRLYLKIILAFIALTSLALIILKPILIVKADKFEIAILTKNYNLRKLDSLKKSNKNLIVKNYKINEPILEPDITPASIYVLGEGISSFDLWQLDSLNVMHLSSEAPSGITRLNHNQYYTIGDKIVIKGLYNKVKKGTKLILETVTKTGLDSIVFANDSTQIFNLSTQLNIVGNYELLITEKDSLENIMSQNPIGIKISEEQKLRVLIINDFPTFETRYLKNFLAENGHEVVVRSQLTRDRYKYEYFNLNNKPLVKFTKKDLEIFDLFIIDNQSFRALSKLQTNTIEKLIRDQGLGLFIQLNSVFRNKSNYITSFNFESDVKTNINLDDISKTKISKHPYTLNEQLSQQTIIKSGNKILSAYKPLENGFIGTSVLTNTYELILNGNSSAYKSLWSRIINSISKKQIPMVYWNNQTSISFKNEPVEFTLRTNIENPIVKKDDYHIPIINNIDNYNLWKGKTYPKKNGWHNLNVKQDSTTLFHFYVNDTAHWKSLRSYNTIISNQRQFMNSNLAIESFKSKKVMNLFWLYIVFIVSVGYLWLEPKL